MTTPSRWTKRVVDDDLEVFSSKSEPDPSQGIVVLLREAATYLSTDKIKLLQDTFIFASDAHEGQMRLTGDKYITHPIAVARVLANLKMDLCTLQAALLHDVVEDCDVSLEIIEAQFSLDLRRLVDGATKVNEIQNLITNPMLNE